MLRKSLVLMVVISLSVAVANATVISMDTLNLQTSEPTLDKFGTILAAVNFTPNAGTATDQGIVFQNATATGSGIVNYGTWNGLTVEGMNETPSQGTMGTADTGAGNPVWHTFAWPSTAFGAVRVSGLDSAKTYRLQLLEGDGRVSSPGDFTFNVDGFGPGDAWTSKTISWGGGTYALATMDVTNATLAGFNITNIVSPGNQGAGFSGLIVSEIPEPSAFLLLGTAMFGLLAYAWRKRR